MCVVVAFFFYKSPELRRFKRWTMALTATTMTLIWLVSYYSEESEDQREKKKAWLLD